MTLTVTIAAYVALLAITMFFTKKSWSEVLKSDYFLIITFGFLVRLIASFITHGFPTDISCFTIWSEGLRQNGLASLYGASGSTDYPPGYLYVLCGLSYIGRLFALKIYTDPFVFLLKIPAIMCDIFTAILAYNIVSKNFSRKSAVTIAFLLLFNPATILDSAVWGQIDSVLVLALVGTVYLLTEKKMLQAVLVFTVAILLKPQALILSPVLIFDFFRYLKEENFSGKAFGRLAVYGLICAGLLFALVIPFAFTKDGFTLSPVFNQYVATLGSYDHVSVNAYNIYALLGLNWVDNSTMFFFMSYRTLGTVFIVVLTLASFYLLYKNSSKANYFLVSGFLYFGMFMLSVKMHERYSMPAIIFLFFAFLYSKNKKTLISYAALSLVFFMNCTDVLVMYISEKLVRNTPLLPFISFLYVLTFGYFAVHLFETAIRKNDEEYEVKALFAGTAPKLGAGEPGITDMTYYEERFDEQGVPLPDTLKSVSDGEAEDLELLPAAEKNEDSSLIDVIAAAVTKFRDKKPDDFIKNREKKMKPKDALILFGIVVVYSLVSFFNLGNTKSAQSFYDFKVNDKPIIVDFGAQTEISRIQWMLGARHDKHFTFMFSLDGIVYDNELVTTEQSVFAWKEMAVNVTARYISIASDADNAYIQEIAFRDTNDEIIKVASVSGGAQSLFDEQDLVPLKYTNMNSTYFDEVYHARTAYEFVHKLPVYEWTHPQLGKYFIAAGIKIFGMTPFGWRFAGNVFGILMIPLVYLFGKRFFGKTSWATVVTLLYTFDFMHFTQTRIATIDTFVTFFIILMYYFMYRFYDSDFNPKNRSRELVWLLFSGISMGLGMACKWPGMYAGAGLAVIFAAAMLKRHRSYKEAVSVQDEELTRGYRANVWKTLAWCVLFFGVIPLSIYMGSFVYYYMYGSMYEGVSRDIEMLKNSSPVFRFFLSEKEPFRFISTFIAEQRRMYVYHSVTVRNSTHPYSSKWFQWPLLYRPMYYYAGTVSQTVRAGISAFGNPAVWWGGIPAFFYSVYQYVKRKDRFVLFMLIGYLAQLAPWMLVERTTYIYHYFPSVFFVVLMIAYMLMTLKTKRRNMIIGIYIALALLLFVLFYPVISGLPVSVSFVNMFLKWKMMTGWVLI